MNFEDLPLIQDHSLSWPSVRGLYLGKASEEYENGNYLYSIYYQVQALCMGARSKHFCNHFEGLIPTKSNNKKSGITPVSTINQNRLLNSYIDEKIKPTTKDNFETKDYPLNNDDVEKKIKEMISGCNIFPREWTIVQICKSFNPETSISLKSESMLCAQPIYLTLLRHPRSESFPEPVCIRLTSDTKLDSVMQQFYHLVNEMKERCAAEGNDRSGRVKFWKQLDYLENDIKDAITNLKGVIGPWATFLCGNICIDQEGVQDDLFAIVDRFSEKYSFKSTVIVLLSMLCRRINLLTNQDIQTASVYLAHIAECDTMEGIFSEFLHDVKSKLQYELTFMPCILITDETLDHIFWEMLSPDQEICRISSLYMLEKIFRKYEKSIANGYINLSIKNGVSLINPDKTLPKTEQRMHSFLSYWMPDWKSYCGKIPTHKDLIKCFQSSDTFIYCGHGSGLQYINGYKITKLYINSVIFLFGCDSVRLLSDGLHSELKGSHIYYHGALSPAIVGCSVVAFDIQLDTMSSEILSTWIPSKASIHWNSINKTAWKKGEISDFAEEDNQNSTPTSYEPRLSLILSKIRANEGQKMYNRILFIYRGLPVWNTCAESI